MPQFRAHILDPLRGEDHVEVVKAASLEKARERLEKRGLTIFWLRPVEEPSPLLAAKDTSRPRPPGPGPRLSGLGFKALLVTGTVLGLLVLIHQWQSLPVAATVAAGEPETVHHLSLQGELVDVGGRAPDPSSVRVTLRLPEIPYGQTWKGAEILSADGRLAQTVELQTSRPAGIGEVLIEAVGFAPIRREGLPVAGSGATLQLGRMVLKPAAAKHSRRRQQEPITPDS